VNIIVRGAVVVVNILVRGAVVVVNILVRVFVTVVGLGVVVGVMVVGVLVVGKRVGEGWEGGITFALILRELPWLVKRSGESTNDWLALVGD